jgi:hypothetical protein
MANYHSDRVEITPKFDTRHGFVTPNGTLQAAVLDSMLFNRIQVETDFTRPSQGTQFERAP